MRMVAGIIEIDCRHFLSCLISPLVDPEVATALNTGPGRFVVPRNSSSRVEGRITYPQEMTTLVIRDRAIFADFMTARPCRRAICGETPFRIDGLRTGKQ